MAASEAVRGPTLLDALSGVRLRNARRTHIGRTERPLIAAGQPPRSTARRSTSQALVTPNPAQDLLPPGNERNACSVAFTSDPGPPTLVQRVRRAIGLVVKLAGMEFFCFHRDRPGSVALRNELLEEHWSYMDRYSMEMIARGPTFASGEDDSPTGSVHIVDLSSPAAARAFTFDEPNYQAGVYRDVLLRRWQNTLRRTMWDYPGGRTGGNRYLVLGLSSGQATDLAGPPDRDELIAYGPLLSDDGTTWLGTAALVRAPDPDTARAVLTTDRYADIEVHNWQFGGRP
jgi:uncharacterized protein YciI